MNVIQKIISCFCTMFRFDYCALFLVALLATQTSANAQDVVRALDARAAGNQERTRFVIDLDGAVKFAAFTLADPYRVVIDVTEIDFDNLTANSREGRGLIGTFRYGLIAKGKSRMVLDLAEPAKIDEAFVLEPVEDQPGRIVFDLVPASREAFLDGVGKLKALGTLETKLPKPAAPIQPRSNKMVIVLDAGHGGIDDGAIGPNGAKEKDLVLKFAKDVSKALNKNNAFEIYMTRSDDTFISLDERVEFARSKGAALMVSFHADTVRESYVRGATVYTLSETATDEVSRALAEKENRSDTIAGVELKNKSDEVADILIDLARRETKNLSVAFAHRLLGELKPAMRLNKNPRRSAGFRVLKAPDVPSVLVELGYLSNGKDEKLLESDEWRQKAADKFVAAIQAYFKATNGKAG